MPITNLNNRQESLFRMPVHGLSFLNYKLQSRNTKIQKFITFFYGSTAIWPSLNFSIQGVCHNLSNPTTSFFLQCHFNVLQACGDPCSIMTSKASDEPWPPKLRHMTSCARLHSHCAPLFKHTNTIHKLAHRLNTVSSSYEALWALF